MLNSRQGYRFKYRPFRISSFFVAYFLEIHAIDRNFRLQPRKFDTLNILLIAMNIH